MTRNLGHPKSWTALKIAAAGAALFSAWAAWGGGGCASCDAAAGILGGRSLGAVGVVFYGFLLAAALARGPSLLVYSGVLAAAGVHVGLLMVLVHARIFCAPCVGAALCALAALAAAFRCDGSNAFRASWVIPGAAILVQWGSLLHGALPALAQGRTKAEAAAEEEFRAPPVAPGDVRMVVYSRPDCGYCLQFDRDVLPGLIREFGKHLEIERRSAESLPGLPTPTLILTGAAQRRFFPGLPESEDLRRTLHDLMEETHDHPTVLEKPR